MGLFCRKKKVPLSEIIYGLLTALNDTSEMQQLRQKQLVDSLTDTETGKPVVKRLKIEDKEIEVPLASLVSHESMEIKEVNVSFQVRIKDLTTRALVTNSMAGKPFTYESLEFVLDKVAGIDDENITINISFKDKDQTKKEKMISITK